MEPIQDKYYHQQPQVSHTSYDKDGKVSDRFWREIGFGFKTPEEAIKGTYIDKKCPFTGITRMKGRILKGIVKSHKMQRSIIVRRDYLHYVDKYKRFEKRHKNVPAHLSPCFRVKDGDIVTIGQCRPLSKTIRFMVLATESVAES